MGSVRRKTIVGDLCWSLVTILGIMNRLAHPFSRLDSTRFCNEDRMEFRVFDTEPLVPPHCIARSELFHQMLLLVPQLAFGNCHSNPMWHRPQLCSIEGAGPRRGFFPYSGQIGVDRPDRSSVRPEATELGMVSIASRHLSQDGTRWQRFSPEGEEALSVEALGMQAPEAHGGMSRFRVRFGVSHTQPRFVEHPE